MPIAATHYKCPACGASLTYGSQSQQLECAACGNSYPLDTIQQAEAIQEDMHSSDSFSWSGNPYSAFSEEEDSHLKAYRCQACGAEIVVDDTTAASECVYCGNPSVMPGVLTGAYRPDGVIPFQKSKEDAQNAFRSHCKGKRLLPKDFFNESRLEKITGVYVPFWLFQADAEADCAYNATRVTSHRQGNYMVTKTAHYLVRRGGHVGFKQVPVDGSSKMDDTMMESIEPFDSDQAQAFSTAYLSGYQAQRHDVDAEACQPRANERIKKSVEELIRGTVTGYTTCTPASTKVQLEHGQVRQVLQPVWMLNTRWRDQMYTFAMNGQTGRFIGDLPTDMGKFWRYLLGIALGIGAGGYAIVFLLFYLGVV